MAGEQLKQFMIGLGFQLDNAGMAKLETFAKNSENYARQMTESVNKLTAALEKSTQANTKHVESHRKMHDTWKIGKEAVLGFVGALTALAVTGEEAVRRVSREFSNLYYLSQRTGVSAKGLETMRFQFEKIGLSAGEADQAIAGLASRMRSQPGLITQITGWVGPIKNAGDAILKLGQEYRKVIDTHGEFSAGEAQFRSVLESMGMDPDQVLQVAKNIGVVSAAATRFKDIIKKLGYGDGERELARLQEKSVEFQRGWVDFRWVVGKVWEGFAGALMPGMTRLMEVFVDSISDVSGGFQTLEDQFTALINEFVGPKGEKGKKFFKELWEDVRKVGSAIRDLPWRNIIRALGQIATAVGGLVVLWGKLADAIGPLEALIVTLAGVYVAKLLLMEGATLALAAAWRVVSAARGGALATGAAGAVAAGGAAAGAGILGGLGASAFALWQLFQQGTGRPGSHTDPKNPLRFTDPSMPFGQGTDAPQFATGGIVPINAHAGEAVLPASLTRMLLGAANQPQAFSTRGGLGGLTDTIEGLAHKFEQWWSGSSAFSPLVVLAEDVYNKLKDALEEVFFGARGGGVSGGAPGEAPGTPTGSVPGSGGRAPGRISPDGAPLPGSPIEGQWYTGSAPARQAEHGGFNYAGIRAPASMGGFRTYPSEFAGVADTARLLQNYVKGGHDTLNKIINRWAPPNENNTALLQKRAQEWSGIDANQKLDLSNPEQLAKVLDVMNRNEFGGKQTVSQENLQSYVKRFLGGEKPAGGEVGTPSSEGGRVKELQSRLAAIRKLPLAARLKAQLEYASEQAGVETEVFSGGQAESGPNRTGSHRHDKGEAGDVQLRDPKTKQLLDMRNPADQARMAQYITAAVAGGVSGVGGAEGYMGAHGLHLGGGAAGTWGASGSFGTAPKWLQDAYHAGLRRRGEIQRAAREKPTPTSAARTDYGRVEVPNALLGIGGASSIPTTNLGAERRASADAASRNFGGGGDREVVHKTETTINVVGAADPHGTAKTTRDLVDRNSPFEMRGRRNAFT